MRLLLDTHVLIWWLERSNELGSNARELISDPSNDVFASAASAWEIAIKKASGKLRVPDDLDQQIDAHGFVPLHINLRHGLLAGSLPPHHRDPFDRMLIAQAMSEGLVIVTRDGHFPKYAVQTLTA